MTLLDAADAAYPSATYPAAAKVILGYIGEKPGTPHVWTAAEVAAVRASGRTWLPIDVPVQGVLSAAVGEQCAIHSIGALNALNHPHYLPVFLDVEYSSWLASKAGVLACLNQFKATMRAAGYLRPYGYLPAAAGFDWIANWTRQRPASLPAGVIGWQYESATQAGDGWDHSVFDSALLDPPVPDPAPTPDPPEGDIMAAKDWTIVKPTTAGTYLLVIPGVGVQVVNDHETTSALKAAGSESVQFGDGDFARLRQFAK